MSAKIIPFRIAVNSIPHRVLCDWLRDNAPMESQTIESALSELARERGMDVFHRDGRLNHNALARELSRSSGKPVQQSFVTRLIQGKLKGKNTTLQPMAAGFRMSLTEFVARIHPESATAPVPSFPPEAGELWELWTQLPRQLRNHFIEQIKSAIDFKRQYPELSAAITGEALQAANSVRIQRQRKRKPG